MLGAVFSFRGRINRLQYFGGLVGLFVAVIVAALVAVFSVGDLNNLQTQPQRAVPAALVLLLTIPIWIWVSFALQARRIRDIGLNPLFVIPGFLLYQVLDQAVASMMAGTSIDPAGSLAALTPHHTVLQPVISLAFSAALLFWPGKAADPFEPTASWVDSVNMDPRAPTTPARAPAPIRASAPIRAPAAVQQAPAFPQARPAGPVPFGRRGL